MEKYTRNCDKDCSGGGEVDVMDVPPSPEIDNSGSAKRRKVGNGELRLSSSKSVRFTSRDSDDVNQSAASCCSSNGSVTDKLNCADLEAETGISVRRESSPTNELKEESSKMESKPQAITECHRTILPKKMPPAAEIEKFFANAEKDLQKRFKDKYNYDIVKDVPLKGRFEWEKVNLER